MTTAELRESARNAEQECRWMDAANLWDLAIHAYPSTSGALARLDIEKMKNRASAARRQAGA